MDIFMKYNYLVNKIIPENFENILIRKSLYFTRMVMQNKFFIPDNIRFLDLVLSWKIILIKILVHSYF